MSISSWHIYIRNGQCYLPTVARTPACLLDIEPVDVVALDDPKALAVAIKAQIARGNPQAPTPDWSAKPKPVVLKHANLSSWKAFEKTLSIFSIQLSGDSYSLMPSMKASSGAWEDDLSKTDTLPATTPIAEVATLAAARISNKK